MTTFCKCISIWRLWRKYGHIQYLLSFLLFMSVFYFEWFTYFILPLKWPNLECGGMSNVHKILFVADPQILGENTESAIARIDCDLFLKSTFRRAYKYVKPDLVVFLGDLMDEGSMASPEEYKRYYMRFRNIFQLDTIPKNKTLFLPGDNDIGGEDEDVTEYKVRRFEKHFPSRPEIVIYKNIKLYRVNGMVRSFPHDDVTNDTSLRIILSHMPLLGINSMFGEEAISQLKPLLIFSAHDHKSVHLVTGKNTPTRELVESLDTSQSAFRFNLLNSGRVNELVVPTASYRMGVLDYGYGVAVLGAEGDILCYFTLWSPERLSHILVYLVFLAFTLIFYIVYFLKKIINRHQRETYTFSKMSV